MRAPPFLLPVLLLVSPVLAAQAPAGSAPRSRQALQAGRLNLQGRFQEAAAAAKKALKSDPDDAAAQLELAVAQSSLAIETNPGGAEAYAVRAAAHDQLGRRHLVLDDLRAAAIRDPRYMDIVHAIEGTPPQEPGPAPGGANPFILLGALLIGAALLGGLGMGGFLLLKRLKGRSAREKGPELAKKSPVSAKKAEAPAMLSPAPVEPAAPPAGGAPAQGDLLCGKFKLMRELGRGAGGPVWAAVDRSTQKAAVIKRVPEEAAKVMSLVAVGQRVASLRHPSIVSIVELFCDNDGLLLVSEAFPSKTLAEELKNGPMEPARAREVLRSVCEGLAHAHACGIVHQSLRPSNILIPPRGPSKVLDFRIALEAPKTDGDRYRAPELAQGKTAPAADVYALGCCLRDMLAPGTGTEVVLKATAAEAADRYQSVQDFAAALESL